MQEERIIVESNRLHGTCQDVFELVLRNIPDSILEARPGQFVLLEPLHLNSVMPRPFSIVHINKDKKTVTLLIKVVGANTLHYSKLQPGEKINVAGPLGKPIPYDEKMNKFILVGGGIGSAALVCLSSELHQKKKEVKILLGARSDIEMVGCDFYKNVGCATQSITDQTGLVTELLNQELSEIEEDLMVVTCGPKPMLKAVYEICEKKNIPCLVILEEIMACGTNSCKSCAVTGKNGDIKNICSEGPALDAAWIDWEIFFPNNRQQRIDPTIKKAASKFSTPFKTELIGKDGRRLILDYPVMNASGCLGIDSLKIGHLDISKIGALMTKAVTVSPRSGNPMPRACETPSGMINSIGLYNLGMEKFLEKKLAEWFEYNKPVLVNISGYSVSDYKILAEAFNKTKVAGIEVNISCPNAKGGGMVFGTDPKITKEVVEVARQAAPEKFLIVKLSPNVTNIVEIAQAAVDGGADCLSLINTIQAMAIDIKTAKPKIGTGYGGLSGPAIRPVAVRMINQVFKANLGVPIIGMGGIDDGEAAAEFLLAGANAVAVGTGSFSDRMIFEEIMKTLERVMAYHEARNVSELTGLVSR